ncbi:MAG: hypothetical protein LBL34_02345, partial [Clostridiales bacterium]|nr:hypothetical protein [Clostridiales bacterium]
KAIYATQGAARRNIYISCRGRTEHICYQRTRPYRIIEIEDAVAEDMLAYIGSKCDVKASVEAPRGSSSGLNLLKIELTKIEEQIKNLLNMVANGNPVTHEYVNRTIAALDAKKKKNMQKIAALKVETKSAADKWNDITMLKIISDWDKMDVSGKKKIAKTAIDYVSIDNDGVFVKYN